MTAEMRDLAERLKKANNALMSLAVEAGGAVEEHRIYGKAEGVRLALSYVEEYLR